MFHEKSVLRVRMSHYAGLASTLWRKTFASRRKLTKSAFFDRCSLF